MRRQGYRATSWRKLIEASGAPWGSAHHYFPGGKSQLGVEAVDLAAEAFVKVLRRAFAGETLPADAIRHVFASAGAGLEAARFDVGCPIAAVAVEVTPDMAALGEACARGFSSWSEVVADELQRRGLDAEAARDLAEHVIATFEGALLLSRTQRSGAPLRRSAEHLVRLPQIQALSPPQED
ncbi:MAG: TetR family transcriptional regulator [Phenylobacterium zucineum]|nr:MAG: TetR family transcriptional regulator [Phenylobacterium zucineum]